MDEVLLQDMLGTVHRDLFTASQATLLAVAPLPEDAASDGMAARGAPGAADRAARR